MRRFRINVDTTTFYVIVEAKDKDDAIDRVSEGLQNGEFIEESKDAEFYCIGKDAEELIKCSACSIEIGINEGFALTVKETIYLCKTCLGKITSMET